jgi:hypothetical protein
MGKMTSEVAAYWNIIEDAMIALTFYGLRRGNNSTPF